MTWWKRLCELALLCCYNGDSCVLVKAVIIVFGCLRDAKGGRCGRVVLEFASRLCARVAGREPALGR